MKRSDTLFRHKANLLYDTGASIREMVYAITSKIGKATIDLTAYNKAGVCEMVGTWVDQDCSEGKWELIDTIITGIGGDIHFSAGMVAKEMYDYSLDELIYLHDEIEKIYKYIVKGKSVNELYDKNMAF